MAYRQQQDYPFHLHEALGQFNCRSAILVHSERYVAYFKERLTGVRELAQHDQFHLYSGLYADEAVIVVCTGIGSLATALVVHELAGLGITAFYKFGSVGSLQADLQVGSIVIPPGAVRLDGTSDNYVESCYPAIASHKLTASLVATMNDKRLNIVEGLILTKNSYYSTLQASAYDYWINRGILGIELECAPLFVISRLKLLDAAAVLVVNRSLDAIKRQKSGEHSKWSESIAEALGNGASAVLDTILKMTTKE